ncbi:TrkA family potassium uptake protein [Pseudarthrobacter sp. J75]|uniref:potassium channel family protein n=1 Tax=unclassified Pseudarthrobacter TaxID=2647000 RepID=UPI002E822240|nr:MULTISPECIES: TrkA family potassium uptake protein [unclassified Pseudarthrobacter]MEE2522072.1 TrkA family potassium uptake protein [Pseudarthrobacter sp. J47]MEE2528997.1 TrkA family potassium uptake protein [Pseudarthrobacter sp. J75]MEE2570668.1 TrkA family potassium uptake protein [Pseudarthrobacter sp. J64]
MARNIFTRTAEHVAQADSVVVIGLGRFGGALARELESQGTEVLGIDAREDIVQSFNGILTHVVRADSTKEEVLRQLSVHEFDRAVVGIGTDIEASILTTSRLLKFNGPQIWAKAISEPHAEILVQLGVEHVIRPEHDMGKRVAHLVRGSILDYVEFEDDFVMVRTSPPAVARDRPLGVLGLRDKYGITIVAVKRRGGTWGHTTAQTVLYDDDQIIVQGTKSLAEKFSTLP